MPIELNNQKILQNNKLIRFLLLILLPILIVLIALGYFYSLGRYITTENAYIKAPIISVQFSLRFLVGLKKFLLEIIKK